MSLRRSLLGVIDIARGALTSPFKADGTMGGRKKSGGSSQKDKEKNSGAKGSREQQHKQALQADNRAERTRRRSEVTPAASVCLPRLIRFRFDRPRAGRASRACRGLDPWASAIGAAGRLTPIIISNCPD